jgi:hypothetical protein
MTREELWKMLEMLPIVARKAEILDKLVKAQEAAGCASLPEFIYSLPMLPVHLLPPSPSADPRQTRGSLSIVKGETLEGFFDEVRHSGYKFEDCFDPGMLEEFISPDWGNGSLRYEDMTDGQKRTVRLIQMKYRQWKKANLGASHA